MGSIHDQGKYRKANNQCFFCTSMFLFLSPLPLSLKPISMSSGEDENNNNKYMWRFQQQQTTHHHPSLICEYACFWPYYELCCHYICFQDYRISATFYLVVKDLWRPTFSHVCDHCYWGDSDEYFRACKTSPPQKRDKKTETLNIAF